MDYHTMFGPSKRPNNYGRAIWVLLTIAIAVPGLSGSIKASEHGIGCLNETAKPGEQGLRLSSQEARQIGKTGRGNHAIAP